MDSLLFANLLRGVISSILNIMLMFSLVELKYSKKFTIIALATICTLIMIATSYFYIFHDLTTLARFNILIWLLAGFACKFLCMDSFMKWLFNVVTVINISFFVMVISYLLSRHFPYPMYANTVVRIALYVIVIILFKKFVYHLYHNVMDRWNQFLLLNMSIMLNISYILITSKNIAETIKQNSIPIFLMLGLVFFVYTSILGSFESIVQEYKFRIEKEQMRLNEDLLSSQLASYEEFIEASKRYRHDLRHHNQIIMEYLKYGDLKGAEEYLRLYDISLTESTARRYCKNHIANAVLSLYAQKTQAEEILFATNADIPENIAMNSPEFASMLSNILENALESCRNTKVDKRFITFTSEIEDESLRIEVQNTVSGKIKMRNNLPVSNKINGGIGTKSVLHIVDKYHGMLNFKQEDNTFITQIILPA